MKQLIYSLLLFGLSLGAKQTKPNIILLMGDDHGWKRFLENYPCTTVRSP